MSDLRLSMALFEQIRTHCEETYPFECCGILLGLATETGWDIKAGIRASNMRTDSAHNRYEISPMELVKIEREARREGLSIAGFYHSHPNHPAQWSKTDLKEAHWLGCWYVITEVAAGKAEATSAFLLTGTSEEDKRFEERTLIVENRDLRM